jgi:hypothetical protein
VVHSYQMSKMFLIPLAILAVIGLVFVSTIPTYFQEQNNLSKTRSESRSALSALNATNIDTSSGRDNCVSQWPGGHQCETDVIFTVSSPSVINSDGWAASENESELANKKYPGCHLSDWDSSKNSYILSCGISW